MGTIRVEAVPIQSYLLGLFRFDHLQLVYQDETDFIDSQDYWYVIEGIQDGPLFTATLGASGEDGTTSLGCDQRRQPRCVDRQNRHAGVARLAHRVNRPDR